MAECNCQCRKNRMMSIDHMVRFESWLAILIAAEISDEASPQGAISKFLRVAYWRSHCAPETEWTGDIHLPRETTCADPSGLKRHDFAFPIGKVPALHELCAHEPEIGGNNSTVASALPFSRLGHFFFAF